ncbi:MAG: protein kinase [Phycisphaerales bacterium]|nr:protein kinase [Phycisphaerales bacterium]MCB9857182.1 protein kinase [Phycisphaerales bacterium]MCB9863105.1 protein kinase [Phycisphaerales bacterium]
MSDGSRHERVSRIMRACLEAAPDERDAVLRREASDDTSIIAEVVSLLDFDRATDNDVFSDDAIREGRQALHRMMDASPDDSDEAARIPESIGCYRIVRKIGEGGMGVVYEAEQENPRRRVALKVIRSQLATDALIKRFQREAHLLGRLQHPGIAHVYESGFATVGGNRLPYLAMELINGCPLDEFVRSRQPDVRQRLEFVALAADAVHHAHQNGVIHRDLKPSNILVAAAVDDSHHAAPGAGPAVGSPTSPVVGRPKIVDFGVARATESDGHLATLQTHVGHLVGTITYMSPEQVAGDVTKLDHRCDIYALGAIAHELLAGKPPLDVRQRSIADAAQVIRDDEPSRLGSVDTLYRGDVETIVGKALEKDPDRRYQTAAELAADIRRFRDHLPILARRASAWYRARKFARRNRILVGGVTATLIVLVIGLVSTTWLAIRESDAHRQADRALYRASLAVADAALRDGDVVTADQHLASVPQAMRGWEWAHYAARLDQSCASINVDLHATQSAQTASRGHAHVWFSETDDRLHVGFFCVREQRLEAGTWDTAALQLLGTWLVPGGNTFAPYGNGDDVLVNVDNEDRLYSADDGKCLASNRHVGIPSIEKLNLLSAVPEALTVGNTRLADDINNCRRCSIVISPNGRFALLAGDEHDTLVYNLTNDEPPVLLESHREGIGNAVFSKDGRYVMTAGNDRRLACFDMEQNGRRVWERPEAHQDAILAAALSPDDRTLATGGQDRVLRLWDAATGQPDGRLVGHHDSILSIEFSSDGQQIASYSLNTVKTWRLETARDPTVLRDHSWYVFSVAISPDGALLASHGASLRLWDARTGTPIFSESPHDGAVYAHVSFSADSRYLLVNRRCSSRGARYNEAFVLDTHTGQIVTSPVGIEIGDEPSFMASGRYVGSNRQDSRFRLTDSKSGETVSEIEGVRSIYVGPSGRILACIADDEVQIRECVSGKVLHCWPAVSASRVFLLRSESVLAVALQQGDVDLFDVDSGRRLGSLVGHASRVTCFAELPSHNRLVTGSDDRTIRLWDIDRLEDVCVLRGHTDRIWDLAVAPDESAIFSASGDYTIRRWDTRPISNLFAARQSYRAAVESLSPRIRRRLEDTDWDLSKVIAEIDADPSLSDRERQIAHQVLLQALSIRHTTSASNNAQMSDDK